MRIGYACINTVIGCTSSKTFRLKNYSKKRFLKTVRENLNCLEKILNWNKENKILFYRITSKLVPFASHPVCKIDWADYFKKEFRMIGRFVKKNKMRITMHPDQFTVINSNKKGVVQRSIKELNYHAQVIKAMKLSKSHKIIIHVGGVYGNKEESIKRFINNYKKLPANIKERLVIENDEKNYTVSDCLIINKEVKTPIIVDNLHHELNNNSESLKEIIKKAKKTWSNKDGPLIIHYSEQKQKSRAGAHSRTITKNKFKEFYKKIKKFNCDIMLEVKDKEQSALKMLKII